LNAIRDSNAENIYVTHGYTDIFTRYLNENGWNASVVQTEFEGETPGDDSEEDAT
jgi:putative mRNA 3-end processing factor